MAKRKADLADIFKKTTPPPADETNEEELPATGRTLSIGVGLKESEVEMLDQIVEELEISRNSIMRYAIRHFLLQYRSGEIALEENVERPTPKAKLKMP